MIWYKCEPPNLTWTLIWFKLEPRYLIRPLNLTTNIWFELWFGSNLTQDVIRADLVVVVRGGGGGVASRVICNVFHWTLLFWCFECRMLCYTPFYWCFLMNKVSLYCLLMNINKIKRICAKSRAIFERWVGDNLRDTQ